MEAPQNTPEAPAAAGLEARQEAAAPQPTPATPAPAESPADGAAIPAPEAVAPAEQEAPKAKAQPKRKVRREVATEATVTATAEKVARLGVEEIEVDALPTSITLAAPYAFYDDGGALQSWAAGQVVEAADEIALLIDRGALLSEAVVPG